MYEIRTVIRFVQIGGLNQKEIHGLLQDIYEPNIWRREEFKVWCQKFKDRQTDVKDDPNPKKKR